MEFDLEEAGERWQLDPAAVHVNHGSFGAVPREVEAEQLRWQRRMRTNPSAYFRREAMPAIAEARASMSEFLGADADGVAFVRNATEACNAVIRSHPLSAGDEILVFDQEYQAVTMTMRRQAAAVGATVVEIAVPTGTTTGEVLGRVASSITERTRMLAFDHVTSATAMLMPAAELVSLCREQGLISVVDASHVPGSIDPQLDHLRPDYWFGNLHKWLCAPVASAVLYVGTAQRAAFRPLITSWFDDQGFPTALDMLGTIDYSAWLASPSAVAFFDQLGFSRVRQANNARAVYGQHVVGEALGVDISGFPTSGLPMALVPLGLAGDHEAAAALCDVVAVQHCIECAITTFDGSLFARISGQLYNRARDYDALAVALVDVVNR